jgi:hypothetical protein
MSLLSKILRRKPNALLTVTVDGTEVLSIEEKDVPCDARISFRSGAGAEIQFVEESGKTHEHHLPADRNGFFHMSVRIHPNFACQADGILSASSEVSVAEDEIRKLEADGVRFQPFFIKRKGVKVPELKGKGLFARGLHYNGVTTPGNVILSGVCDECEKSFLFRSFHAGFSELGYFYSGSGKHTLTVSAMEPGAPAALSEPDPELLANLERRLPSAPDMTKFSYLNPFRCPHCQAAYIDFEKHPEIRSSEYYGNQFLGVKAIRF